MELGLQISQKNPSSSEGGGGNGTGSNASAQILITRRSFLEVAPEGVLFEVALSGFDAQGPTGNDIYDDRYHDIYYYWDFGDSYGYSAPQNLVQAFASSGTAFGGRAAHTYRQAGTYTVTLTVRGQVSGIWETVETTLDVTIGDPDILFGGIATHFVAPDGDFSNKPANAVEHTSLDSAINAVKGQQDAPRRIMLKRGQSYTTAGLVLGKNVASRWPSAHIVAQAGSGARPAITFTTQGWNWTDKQSTGAPKDFVLQGLQLSGGWDASTETGAVFDFMGLRDNKPYVLLMDDCHVDGFSTTFREDQNVPGEQTGTKIINDSVITNWRDYAILDMSHLYTVLTGSRLAQAENAHGGGAKDGAHNNHGPYRSGKTHGLIVHSCDFYSRTGWFVNVPPYHTTQPCLRFAMGAGSPIGTITGPWLFAHGNAFEGGYRVFRIARQNSTTEENPVNAVVAQNYFLGSHFTAHIIQVEYGGVTIRNNIMVFSDALRIDAVFDPSRFVDLNWPGANLISRDAPIRVFNNTMVMATSTGSFSGSASLAQETANSGFSNVSIDNNLLHAPALSPPHVPHAPLSDSDHLLFGWPPREPGYRDDTITQLQTQHATPEASVHSYAPLLGSSALGAALNGITALDDFYGQERPQFEALGALEMP